MVEWSNNVALAIGLTCAAGLASVIGFLFAFLPKAGTPQFLAGFLALSAGVMTFVSLVEIFSEAVHMLGESGYTEEHATNITIGIFFAGVLITLVLDLVSHFITRHKAAHSSTMGSLEEGGSQSTIDPCNAVPLQEMASTAQVVPTCPAPNSESLKKTGILTAVAVCLHNFPEGIATFLATLENPEAGIALAIAIGIHNIPEGIAIAIPVYRATNSKLQAFLYTFVAGIAEPIGGILAWLILADVIGPAVIAVMLALTAGIMVYVAILKLQAQAVLHDPSNLWAGNGFLFGHQCDLFGSKRSQTLIVFIDILSHSVFCAVNAGSRSVDGTGSATFAGHSLEVPVWFLLSQRERGPQRPTENSTTHGNALDTSHVAASTTDGKREVFTQSDFRESDIQTDPFSPMIAPDGAPVPPNLLELSGLTFRDGLLLGEKAVLLVERMKERKAAEESLPEGSDFESLAIRAQMIEDMELKELKRKDEEITQMQERRVELLRQALQNLRKEHEATTEERKERLVSRLTDVKDRKLSELANHRMRAVRRGERDRVKVVKELVRLGRGEPPTDRHLQAHTEPASNLYAPITREGCVPLRLTGKMDIQPAALKSLKGIVQLEKELEGEMQPEPKITCIPPGQNARRWEATKSILKDAMAQAKADLDAATSKERKTATEPGHQQGSTVADHGQRERVRDEEVEQVSLRLTGSPESEETVAAVVLLTRVLRGRAIQNEMLRGVAKRAALIEELRACESWVGTPGGSDSEAVTDGLPAELLQEGLISSLIGSTVGVTLDKLSKELLKAKEERRIAAMAWLANRERRLRQVKESGMRQAEERIRAREDTAYQNLARGNQQAADSYLSAILDLTVGEQSREAALQEVKACTDSLNRVMDSFAAREGETSQEDQANVVKDLINWYRVFWRGLSGSWITTSVSSFRRLNVPESPSSSAYKRNGSFMLQTRRFMGQLQV
ncbi:Zinc transporter [Perkinsus chesapeaki]|uniref:Cilia- and flagella-associated protein 91 n=1 Tax=Perkinsus chesapeaki TaxID=330153 RepID=A0A7J6N2M3_PERCH|nr:Zinc transporter [Perkinsus chesapeaki]